MKTIIYTIIIIFPIKLLAEPAGFEIKNMSGKSESITITTGVSVFGVKLRSGENFVYKTSSSMSHPIVLKSFINGFKDEKNTFQWATFTIDKSGRYLSTFTNQASKTFPLEDITKNATVYVDCNEYSISLTSELKK